jgi:hypothetical protein
VDKDKVMLHRTGTRRVRHRFIWPAILIGAGAMASLMLGSVRAGAAPVPPTSVGINLPPLAFWVETRSFSNLALYGTLQIILPGNKFVQIEPEMVNVNGWPGNLPADVTASIQLLMPQAAKRGDAFRCSWQGQAVANVAGYARATRADANNLDFVLTADSFDTLHGLSKRAEVSLRLSGMSPSAPLADVDCREANRPRTQIYDPGFIRNLASYRVVRFMDWMGVNGVPAADFAREVAPQRPIGPGNSVTLTNMIALAREAKIDPWFNIPYGASDAYIRQFAQMAHDRLPPDRTVYVELGNEMWNPQFYATRQAMADGVAAKLSTNPYEAELRQYALRSKHMLDIWTQVYADHPRRLVRIVSPQMYNTYSTNTILGFRDVAKSVDAIAIAPYFGNTLYPQSNAGPRPASLEEAFSKLKGAVKETLAAAREQKVIADRMGKRLIAYEAGQHILIPDNVALLQQINVDPRMGQIYTTFLDGWASEIGDTIMLYHQVGPVVNFGAWGLEEYDNQPLSQAPKKKAVLDFIARHPAPAP